MKFQARAVSRPGNVVSGYWFTNPREKNRERQRTSNIWLHDSGTETKRSSPCIQQYLNFPYATNFVTVNLFRSVIIPILSFCVHLYHISLCWLEFILVTCTFPENPGNINLGCRASLSLSPINRASAFILRSSYIC